jgi:hypothetical protein
MVMIARLEDLLRRPEDAIETLRQELTAHPRHLPALIAFARLLERQNQIDEFAGAISRIEQFDPQAIELPLMRAQLAFRRASSTAHSNWRGTRPKASTPARAPS